MDTAYCGRVDGRENRAASEKKEEKRKTIMQWIKDFYGNLIDLIGFIVGKTSDQGADIVIRALPLVSPAPNAISVYYVSQTALNFRQGQALVFACTVEFLLFGLFEVTLLMFDGLQGNSRRYKYPFWIMLGVSTLVMFLIIGVVYYVEAAHSVLAVLPLFSAAGATALALKRWHVRNLETEIVQQKRTVETVQTEPKKLHSGKNRKIPEYSETVQNRPTGEDLAKEKLFDILDREKSGDLPRQKREDLYKQVGLTRTRMYELIKQWSVEQHPEIVQQLPQPVMHLNGNKKEIS
jgi:hypothetical protein